MSLKEGGSITAHVPQTLPSFAQAFSTSSLGSLPSNNMNVSLPPIYPQSPPGQYGRVATSSSQPTSRPPSEESSAVPKMIKKRTHVETTSDAYDDHRLGSDASPRMPLVKEEPDLDMLSDPSAIVSVHDTSGTLHPQPSAAKKRRVTVSGTPALNTDIINPRDQTNSTPISPVVIGFTIQRDDPSAAEAVRSMISVKQKQKALIDQRRESFAGSLPAAPGSSNEERSPNMSRTSGPARQSRWSPNHGNLGTSRRQTISGNPRQQSPSQPQQLQPPESSTQGINRTMHSLPPPPISFAHRRASQFGATGKRKPADIVISPREDQTPEQFAPTIQSAPPIPHAGTRFNFQMTLPRLPSVLAEGDSFKRPVGGNVPPTPTRLAMQRDNNQSIRPIPGISNSGRRSPGIASVAISSALVPPTPHTLQHPGYSGDKSAFLAPFEMFYDALNDSKQLKGWLGEQIQRSNTLIQSLQQQQDKIHEAIDVAVEKRLAPMKAEMSSLYRRIDELEDIIRYSTTSTPKVSIKGKQPVRNGNPTSTIEPYSFPSIDRRGEPERRPLPSPQMPWHERDPRESQGMMESEGGSPPPYPYTTRRLSLSASRLDPSQRSNGEPSQGRIPGSAYSPPSNRESQLRHGLQPSSGKAKRPHSVQRRQPSPRMSSLSGGGREHETSSPPRFHGRSRRNSIDMAPPDSS